MTKAEWDALLADLRSLDIDRAVRAVKLLHDGADATDLPRLRSLIKNGKDFFIREAAAAPLARLEGVRALPLMFEALTLGVREGHDNDGLAHFVSEVLLGDPTGAAPLLLKMLRSRQAETREHAAWALGWMPTEVALGPLLKAVRDKEPKVRATATGSLGNSTFRAQPGVFEALKQALEEDDPVVRQSAASALGYLGDRRAKPALRRALEDEADGVRSSAEYALQKLKDVGPLPEEERKAVFRALVEAQDRQLSVLQSRALVAEQFGLTERELRQIEREGTDKGWPPL
jgi:HEAT repeat protein